MSILGDVLDELAETIIPEVAEIVFPDACFITRATETKDSGGATKTTWADVNTDAIPCSYEPRTVRKQEIGGAWVSVGGYVLTIPTNQDSTLIDLRASDRIRVIARGNQPEKLFKVIGIKNDSGVINEVDCEIEN